MGGEQNRKFVLQITGGVLAVLSLVLSCCFTIDGISDRAMRTLGVLAATLFLQIFETFDLCVSCLLSSALLYAFGCVDTISDAFGGYTNHVIYFTLASFGVSLAFQKSALSKRLLSFIIRSKKLRVRGITFIFMLCAAALSSIMSNVAAVVIFIPYVEMFLEYYEKPEERKQSSRCMMICLVVAAMIGGMITPAGSSMNLISIDILEKQAGVGIRFIDWVMIGLPVALIMLVIAFFVITTVYPPHELSRQEMEKYLKMVGEKKPMTAMDIYIAVLIGGIVFTWILSSWVPSINITVTSLIGFGLMFLPKFPVMTWKEFSATNSWPAFFVAGNHITLASVVIATGLCDYFTKLLFPAGADYPTVLMIAKIAAITFIFMAVLPSAPAVSTILSPIVIGFGLSNGINPVMVLMASALCVPNIYLFPLDAPLIVAYEKKAFTMFELPKATIWIQLAMIGVVAIWIPFIFHLI
jgi:sodium-dependent dicarboxylate transporter 2/3/5